MRLESQVPLLGPGIPPYSTPHPGPPEYAGSKMPSDLHRYQHCGDLHLMDRRRRWRHSQDISPLVDIGNNPDPYGVAFAVAACLQAVVVDSRKPSDKVACDNVRHLLRGTETGAAARHDDQYHFVQTLACLSHQRCLISVTCVGVTVAIHAIWVARRVGVHHTHEHGVANAIVLILKAICVGIPTGWTGDATSSASTSSGMAVDDHDVVDIPQGATGLK
jgi:hypothetical protein